MHLQKFQQYKTLVLKSQKQKSEAISPRLFGAFILPSQELVFLRTTLNNQLPVSATTKNANIFLCGLYEYNC
jgi:hypothetical protein